MFLTRRHPQARVVVHVSTPRIWLYNYRRVVLGRINKGCECSLSAGAGEGDNGGRGARRAGGGDLTPFHPDAAARRGVPAVIVLVNLTRVNTRAHERRSRRPPRPAPASACAPVSPGSPKTTTKNMPNDETEDVNVKLTFVRTICRPLVFVVNKITRATARDRRTAVRLDGAPAAAAGLGSSL
ncbi:hypothetical protein EVAR_40627_1 [Eumeta japonica]|uniref:Uncharacterized protein n=1 Tax=Eumeta variegata TaxID=151549 RepID=A0A4C1X771_EUMVA|nr:hypothetical protein EVAR_40627_1 [Eumeta japonica]